MSLYNEDRMTTRINAWSGGRVTVAVAAALVIGFVLGAAFI